MLKLVEVLCSENNKNIDADSELRITGYNLKVVLKIVNYCDPTANRQPTVPSISQQKQRNGLVTDIA